MIERLAGHLDVPLRERNRLLLAGGFAPAHPEHALDEPDLAAVRDALRVVLAAHEPHPAVLLNRWWELVDANAAVAPLLDGVDPALLEPPVNVLRLSLHPRRARAADRQPRPVARPPPRAAAPAHRAHRRPAAGRARRGAGRLPRREPEPASATDVVLPLRLASPAGELSFFSIAAHVGTATDVTVDELTLEAFYPADRATALALGSDLGSTGCARPPQTCRSGCGRRSHAADFTVDAVRELLGEVADAALLRNETTPALRRTATEHGPLATLTRLFLLQTTVTADAAEAALPDLVDRLVAEGVLDRSVGEVAARLDVRPYAADDSTLWVVSDLTPGLDGLPHRVGADHVLGISPASTSLAQLTVRGAGRPAASTSAPAAACRRCTSRPTAATWSRPTSTSGHSASRGSTPPSTRSATGRGARGLLLEPVRGERST